jgi:hypothetical protein
MQEGDGYAEGSSTARLKTLARCARSIELGVLAQRSKAADAVAPCF